MAWGEDAAEQYEKDQPSTVATSTAPCDLHDLTGCSICSGLDKKLAADDQETFELVGPRAYALYPGKCPKCGEEFVVSAPIFRTDAGWICCP